MRQAQKFIPLTFTTLSAAEVIKTHIYIDQIPLYSSLPPCAQDRLSAIVRAQSSGCSDDHQLTSFSCFCISQSSTMSNIISTAVQTACGAYAPPAPTAHPQIADALNVFQSYCARSTELPWYKDNSTATVTTTEAPSSTSILSAVGTTQASSSQTSSNPVPIAAIIVPIIAIIAITAAIAGFLFWRRRKPAEQGRRHPYTDKNIDHDAPHANITIYPPKFPTENSLRTHSNISLPPHYLEDAIRVSTDVLPSPPHRHDASPIYPSTGGTEGIGGEEKKDAGIDEKMENIRRGAVAFRHELDGTGVSRRLEVDGIGVPAEKL